MADGDTRERSWNKVTLLLLGIVLITASCIIHPALLLVLLGIAAVAWIVFGILRWRANPPYTVAWRCARCGYGLYGISEPVCPECGQPLDERQLLNAPPGLYAFKRDRTDKQMPDSAIDRARGQRNGKEHRQPDDSSRGER